MDLNGFFLLFPSIFILHELEEILLFPRFMRRNPKLQQQFLAATFTPFRFNAIVCQEFILLLIVLGLSMYFVKLRHLHHCHHSVYIPCDWACNSKYFFCNSIYRAFLAVLSRLDIAHIRYMMWYRRTVCY